MIKQAEEKKQRLDFPNARLCITDASKMAFKDGCFDKVIAVPFDHRDSGSLLETLKEIKRVCKKNAEGLSF